MEKLSTYRFTVIFIIISLIFTLIGWLCVFFFIGNKVPSFFMHIVGFLIWPSLLLDKIGIMVTNHSFGFIPNAIGWGLIGITIDLIRKTSSST